jgi:hypothetical protein
MTQAAQFNPVCFPYTRRHSQSAMIHHHLLYSLTMPPLFPANPQSHLFYKCYKLASSLNATWLVLGTQSLL